MKIISIDAGGSKTIGALIENGMVLKYSNSGFGNVLIHRKSALKHIDDVIKELYEKNIDHIIIGMAGSESIDKKTIIKELNYKSAISIITDVELAYYDVLPTDGILVIAGTGSVVLAKSKQIYYKSGGWGHLLGDEGSGYSIGLKMIQTAINDFEQGYDSDLLKLIKTHYNLNSLEEIKFVYNEPKSKIAELSYVLTRLQDPIADKLFATESSRLADTVKHMINKHTLQLTSIGLTGSVMKHDFFRETFKEQMGLDYDYFISLEDHTKGGWHWLNTQLD